MTCNLLQTIIATAWNKYAKTNLVSIRSKSWWNSECSHAKAVFDDTRSKDDYQIFRKVTRETKCSFYEQHIQDIFLEAKCPWNLVGWTKPRHLPTHESISYNGEVCTTLPQLWDSLHASYNSAADRPWDENLLAQVEEWKERDWYPFSASEIQEALSKCSNTSAPGPDHLSWCHLNYLFKNHS